MSSRGVLLEQRARGNCPRCPPSIWLCLEYIKDLKRQFCRHLCVALHRCGIHFDKKRANVGLKLALVEKYWLQPSSWPVHLLWLWDIFRGVVGWERVRLRTASPHPFCTTLKDGCNLTVVTRRFALLVKSLQWDRKIQCGNSCRRMLTLFELFGAVFLSIGGRTVSTPIF